MRIYIANLGKYNEGELVGAWFTPPVDYDEMAERIGLNDRYEEYAIHDLKKRAIHAMIRERLVEWSFCHDLYI